ncbi:MAG: DNA mismatch repair protein MutS, partial [Anaerolineales bacterium]
MTENPLPRDLAVLRDTLERLPQISALLDGAPAGGNESSAARARPRLAQFGSFGAELDLLRRAIVDDPPATLQHTGIIRPGFSQELDSVVSASQHARDWISSLETTERDRTGIKSLKVGYNKVFGYYIEISRS